ncbi:MAG: hypothetical protein M3Y41_00130, partial [Pseudomonadota bacterium]|nr:hypothetical protein [Pseudomonadota bacterium]
MSVDPLLALIPYCPTRSLARAWEPEQHPGFAGRLAGMLSSAGSRPGRSRAPGTPPLVLDCRQTRARVRELLDAATGADAITRRGRRQGRAPSVR